MLPWCPYRPAAFTTFWDRVTCKLRRSTRHRSGLELTTADRCRAYTVFGQSVGGYLLQVRRPDGALTRANRAGLAMALAVPMHSMGPGLLPHLPSLGARLRVPELGTVADAAAMRCALRHPRLGDLFTAIDRVRESDDAVLAPRHTEWMRESSLGRMRVALNLARALPPRVVESPSLQRAIQRHLERSAAATDLLGWLRRRATALWGYAPADGQLRVFYSRLRSLFRAFLDFVAMATLRTVANAWLTTRRMSRRPAGCVFGCQAVGGDCMRHYFSCPRVATAIRHSRAIPPCWVHIGHVGLATLAVPLSPEATLRAWNYILFLMYSSARRGTRPLMASEVAELLRACARSAAVRAPAMRRVIAPHLA